MDHLAHSQILILNDLFWLGTFCYAIRVRVAAISVNRCCHSHLLLNYTNTHTASDTQPSHMHSLGPITWFLLHLPSLSLCLCCLPISCDVHCTMHVPRPIILMDARTSSRNIRHSHHDHLLWLHTTSAAATPATIDGWRERKRSPCQRKRAARYIACSEARIHVFVFRVLLIKAKCSVSFRTKNISWMRLQFKCNHFDCLRRWQKSPWHRWHGKCVCAHTSLIHSIQQVQICWRQLEPVTRVTAIENRNRQLIAMVSHGPFLATYVQWRSHWSTLKILQLFIWLDFLLCRRA